MSKNVLMRRFSLSKGGTVVRNGKPPTIMFLVCLLAFVLVLISFIFYLKAYDLRNPDELDWNNFREKMASLDYCLKYPLHGAKYIQEESHPHSSETENSYFYDLTFDTDYWGSLDELKNLKVLEGSIDGFLFGKEKETLDIKFQIQSIKKNPVSSCNRRIINDKECHEYLISGCVSLTALTSIFPKTQAPQTCSFKKFKPKFSNQTARFIVYKETPELPYQFWCPSDFGAKTIIKKMIDPSLTAFLTEVDKELITKNLKYVIIGLTFAIFLLIIKISMNMKRRPVISYSNLNLSDM